MNESNRLWNLWRLATSRKFIMVLLTYLGMLGFEVDPMVQAGVTGLAAIAFIVTTAWEDVSAAEQLLEDLSPTVEPAAISQIRNG